MSPDGPSLIGLSHTRVGLAPRTASAAMREPEPHFTAATVVIGNVDMLHTTRVRGIAAGPTLELSIDAAVRTAHVHRLALRMERQPPRPCDPSDRRGACSKATRGVGSTPRCARASARCCRLLRRGVGSITANVGAASKLRFERSSARCCRLLIRAGVCSIMENAGVASRCTRCLLCKGLSTPMQGIVILHSDETACVRTRASASDDNAQSAATAVTVRIKM